MAASVVRGEAAESDSDTETPPKGSTVTGEASESDGETELRSIHLTPSLATGHYTNDAPREPPKTFSSLLHTKLVERNTSFHDNVIKVSKHTIQTSLTQLSNIDQQLLKSQLRLQQANASLKILEMSTAQLADRLSLAACSAYIPQISIPLPDAE